MAIKLVVQNKSDKQALEAWEELLLEIQNSTPIDVNETEQERKERMKRLEKPGNEEQWIEYYFPKYSFAKPAKFHIASTKRVVHATRIYQRRAWARGLAKSTRRMFEVFYLIFVKQLKANLLLISKSEGNAIRLLAPYRAVLEANQRLINDYGKQKRTGKWKEEEFITRKGCSFRAVGADQNPRGAKLEEVRTNVLIFDDIDDDEVCRNIDRLNERWKWIERAVIPTVEISKPYYIFFDNNIIAEDSIAVRAEKYASDVELINIRDAAGKSVWDKNTEEAIDDILSKISYESGQAEYFNNPMSQGTTFETITYGKCPPISRLPFVQIYADPATSNNDKPTAKSKAQTSSKAVYLMGSPDGVRLYIYYGFLGAVSNSKFIGWLYATYKYALKHKAKVIYVSMENNTLQDPFYKQVFMPLITAMTKTEGLVLPIVPDARAKPDKWFRIEGNLEPVNRNGNMIFNQAEKENPHLTALETQFKAAKSTSRALDGPDCIEGGWYLIKERLMVNTTQNFTIGATRHNSKRF